MEENIFDRIDKEDKEGFNDAVAAAMEISNLLEKRFGDLPLHMQITQSLYSQARALRASIEATKVVCHDQSDTILGFVVHLLKGESLDDYYNTLN